MSVGFSKRGHVAIVTLDDPEHRNALSRAMVRGLLDALAQAKQSGARALIVTGNGKAFCAGADIRDLLAAGWMSGQSDGPDPVDVFQALDQSERLVIAAVHGMALGGGFELILSCDLAIASPDATFAAPEAGHGVIPNTALGRLPRLIGVRRAMEIALTGRFVSAQEALELGLISMVVPRETLLESAIAVANGIVAKGSPGAIAGIKDGLRRHEPTDWKEVRQSLLRIPEAEWREGLSAFLEQRKPDYETFWGLE